jgi:hypothetical protein
MAKMARSEHRLKGKDQDGQAVYAEPSTKSEFAAAKESAHVIAESTGRDCVLLGQLKDVAILSHLLTNNGSYPQ